VRLRTLILSLSVGIGFLFGLVALFEASRLLRWGFNELNATYVKDLTEIIRTSLESKKGAMRSYGHTLGLNFNLSGIYVVARESEDPKMVAHSLQSIQSRSGFDIVDIFDEKGGRSITHGFSIEPEQFQTLLRRNEPITVMEIYNEMALVGFFPLNLYGAPVGYVMLGYYLNRAIANELGSARARVRFAFGAKDPSALLTANLTALDGRPVALSLTTEKDFLSEIRTSLSRNLAIFAAICLISLIALIFLSLHYGFVGKFQAYLQKIDRASRELSDGKIPTIPPASPEPIAELNQLARSFEQFATSIATYDARVKEQSRLAAEAQKRAALSELAHEVAHNIRSPLSALDMLVTATDQIPVERRLLIQGAMMRVHDLADRVLDAHRAPERNIGEVSIDSLLENLIEEKRFGWRLRPALKLSFSGTSPVHPRFVQIDAGQLKAVISNLLNNAAEAIPDTGEIAVRLSGIDDNVEVAITDNGAGIAPEVLERLGEKGATFGKTEGSGIGLFHARNVLREAGGTLNIESVLGVGTTVRVRLPVVAPPAWFLGELTLPSEGTVIAIDDDRLVLNEWQRRFAEASPAAQFHVFSSINECLQWAKHQSEPIALVLSDYDTGELRNGLDLIGELRAQNGVTTAVLVTARAEDPALAEACVREGVKLFSKNLLFTASRPA